MNSQNANVDLVGKEGGQGQLASKFSGGNRLNIGAMRPFVGEDGKVYMTSYSGGPTNKKSSYKTMQINKKGTLRRDEWRQLDEAVVKIADNRLSGVQDIIDRGLTYNLGNAMGTTSLEYHNVSDAMKAELSMDAVTRTEGDKVEFDSVFLPIPIIHSDYEINQRVLENSRRLGNPLDTISAERATRKIMEKREKMLFSDTDYNFGGGTIYSFLNFPDRIHAAGTGDQNIGNITNWSLDATSGADIISDVLNMKQASITNNYYGPWVLYIPTNFETKLDQDYSDSKNTNTIRERIMSINNIEDIVVVDTLPDSNVVMPQMTSDVIRIVQGLAMQNVQWETEGGFVNKFKTISIQVPQVRGDQEGRTGIVHATPS
jgi:hypothetical protein